MQVGFADCQEWSRPYGWASEMTRGLSLDAAVFLGRSRRLDPIPAGHVWSRTGAACASIKSIVLAMLPSCCRVVGRHMVF